MQDLYQVEALDPHILTQTAKALKDTIHGDKFIPPGSDAVRVLLNLAINGKTELTKRAAALEMAAWIRRLFAVTGTFKTILHSQAEIIQDKAKDFPGAEDVGKSCLKLYQDNIAQLNSRMEENEKEVYETDLSEVLGIKEFIREQIGDLFPLPSGIPE